MPSTRPRASSPELTGRGPGAALVRCLSAAALVVAGLGGLALGAEARSSLASPDPADGAPGWKLTPQSLASIERALGADCLVSEPTESDATEDSPEAGAAASAAHAPTPPGRAGERLDGAPIRIAQTFVPSRQPCGPPATFAS